MNKRQIKNANKRAARILNRKRSYGSLRRVAMPRGFKGAKNICQAEMLDLHACGMDMLNILVCNAYRLGFKAGRASRAA